MTSRTSHSSTASTTSVERLGLGERTARGHLSPWSAAGTTVRSVPSGNSSGRPMESRSPCTTRVGTPAPVSSSTRDFSGRPGGWSGNASARQPTAPRSRGAAGGGPRAGRAAADDERRPRPQRAVRGLEADVEGGRRGRDLPAGDPPRLLEQGHGDAMRGQRGRQGHQVARLDAVAGAVAEEQGHRRRRGRRARRAAPRRTAWGPHRARVTRPLTAGRPRPGWARPARDRCCGRC